MRKRRDGVAPSHYAEPEIGTPADEPFTRHRGNFLVNLNRHHVHRRNARRLGFAFWSNLLLAIMWTAMLPVTLITSLKASVPFVAAISIYALMIGHTTGALAALAGKTSSENATKLHSPDEPPGP